MIFLILWLIGHESAFSGNVNLLGRFGRPNCLSKWYQLKFSRKKVVWYRWSAVVYGDRPIIIWIFKNFAEFSNIFQKIRNKSLMRIQKTVCCATKTLETVWKYVNFSGNPVKIGNPLQTISRVFVAQKTVKFIWHQGFIS